MDYFGFLLFFVLSCYCIQMTNSYCIGDSREAKKLRQLKKNTKFNNNPCECDGDSCKCCAKVTVEGETDEGCASFKMPGTRSKNGMVRYSFNFNDQSASQYAPAGKDPKGMCQPFSNWPNMSACSRFHSTKVENGKVRFCLTMEGKYMGFTFYEMDFDCVTYDVASQQQVGNK